MADAVALIPDRALVYVAGLMGTATALVDAVAENYQRWQRLTTTADYLFAPLATFVTPDGLADERWPFTHVSLQPSGATGDLGLDRLNIVPAHSSDFYQLYRPGGRLAVDVALVQVSPPGPDGRFSLGVAGGAAPEVVCTADIVIAEVNARMPYIAGPVAFERDQFDLLVEVEHELSFLPGSESLEAGGGRMGTVDDADPGSVPGRIALHLIEEIPDWATVEYGIGAIPDAVVSALSGHQRLGLHSGMIGEAAMGLIDCGAMDGSAKTVDRGLHVASAVVGGPEAVNWVRDRDDVVIVASNYSHAVDSLARHERLVAINSAIEVSADGSVNAEHIGQRVVSGPGGQPDFAAGAFLSAGGMAIVALPSTAKRGTASRVVSELDGSVPVTVPRYLADRVVTEHGIARLRGVGIAERRARLKAIADELFRTHLDE